MRWLTIAVALLAAYAMAGFWLVPFVIRHQVPRIAQTELGRQGSIGRVGFNPFTLRLVASDLRLTEADGTPLFAVGNLNGQLQWGSIVRRAWSFAEIRITRPSANLLVAPDGRFNLAELLATLEQRRGTSSPQAGLPRVVIEKFALEQGKVDLRDRRAGYANVLAPIEFELTHFSTLPDQNDSHSFSAQSARGGKLHWKGTASVNPIRGSGELTIQDASLPELAVYLKPYTRATVAAGRLSASLPYAFSYIDGKFEARLAGAAVSLRDLALSRAGASDSFAGLTRLDVNDIAGDLARGEVAVGEVRADGGKLRIQRDAKGELDLANLMVATAGPAAAASSPGRQVVLDDWKLAVKQLVFDQVAISVVDETVSPPLRLEAKQARLQSKLAAQRSGAGFQLTLTDAALSLSDLALSSGAQTPLQFAQLGFSDGNLDFAAQRVGIGLLYLQQGQLQLTRVRGGQFNVANLLPRFDAAAGQSAPAAAGKPWRVSVGNVDVSRIGAEVADEDSGVKVHVVDLAAKLEGASSDLQQPVRFQAGLSLREGGQLSAQGSAVPATGALQADVVVRRLALAPLQPMLAHYLKLKIAGGVGSAQGRITAGAKEVGLRYVGAVNIAGLVLNEDDGELFASWRNLGADRISASLGPNRLEIPELRLVEPNAKLIIESDRSFNAARLLVRAPDYRATTTSSAATAPHAGDDPFPVRIRRVRLQNAKLDFTDLSLRPQFAAKMYELNGVINGLSTNHEARSQVELDGRVDEFGSARIRGELNPFAPANNTDLNLVLRNADMVPASPYTMKFAGYRIAQGKLSADLQYQVRNGQLQGSNKIVIDNLTLGERVDSPDALKLPLELAIAILKDSDGRIDLGVPISGNLDDPQFSYGEIIWKAIGNLLTRIVTAPFRALGALLGGGSGEKLEAIDFDPGSDRLLPPEREKLQQVVQVLAKRPQLKLSVPGQYSEAADGAALKARAVRVEIARRSGIRLEAGEEPGPIDVGNGKVRRALREFYAERFGDAELDKQKQAAEAGSTTAMGAARAASEPAGAAQALPLWQRVGKMIQGEPQVADASAFYNQLRQRLEQAQPLPADALARLGTQRANAVVIALKEAGIDPARAVATAPEKVESAAGKSVPLKLALGT